MSYYLLARRKTLVPGGPDFPEPVPPPTPPRPPRREGIETIGPTTYRAAARSAFYGPSKDDPGNRGEPNIL